jgi:hypothetical protein
VEHVHAATPASRRVGLIAGYYRITAVLSGVGLALASTHWSSFWPAVLAHPLAFASGLFSVATCWWTGELIGQRQRRGAWVAVTSIGLGALSRVAAHPTSASVIIFGAGLGLAAIASIWRELE